MPKHFDAIILGAGTAGLAALSEVRKHTDNFLIVNDGPYGTTCARVGCMPSKLLIEAANAYHRRGSFDTFGIRGASALSVDFPAVMQRVRAMRDDFVASTLALTDTLGKRSMAGRARLRGPDCVEVNGERLTARAIIIATGSHPFIPKPWQAFADRVLTTDTLFEQTHIGPRLGVVGLGPLGAELAQALARLGIEVSAFARKDMLAGLRDPDINAELRTALAADMPLHTGAQAQLEAVDGGIAITSGDTRVMVDQVLAAVGRRPNVQGLGLETLGVPLDEHGMPAFDPGSTQVGDLRVFIAGDVNGDRPLLHEAADEGHIAGMNALADEVRCYKRRTPLSIVFTDPEVAVVGASTAHLAPPSYVVGSASFAHQGRARAGQRNAGRIALYADGTDGKLLGAELCAPAGEHLAHLLGLAVSQGLRVQDLLAMPIYHPVLEEGLRTALRDASRKLRGPRASDLAHCAPMGSAALE
ncbi:MAG: dihydrolipoyl dehydrogenase [Burkholderiaceae bacterium]|nr:dihydrolipoyl dehydrogenase [Burkholderiaceae bacterium]